MRVDGVGEDGCEKGDEKADEGEHGGCDVEKMDFRSRLKPLKLKRAQSTDGT